MNCPIANQIPKGVCMSMCPETEVSIREANGLLHPFEILSKSDASKEPKADHNKIIKEYSRPAAGRSHLTPEELRPGPVLLRTTAYLLESLVCRDDYPWHMVYEYVFDRLRAVRQDLTIQRIKDKNAIIILERSSRFLVYSNYRLCMAPMKHFDPKINGTHIQECLKKLLVLYHAAETCCCREGEFVALYLLFNIDSAEALKYSLEMRYRLNHTPVFRRAIALALAWWTGNYRRVFRLAFGLPALHLCALHRNFSHMITHVLHIMSVAYNSKTLTYPLQDLASLFQICTDDMTKICQSCGFVVKENKLHLVKLDFCPNTVSSCHNECIDAELKSTELDVLLMGSDCSACPFVGT